MIFLGLALAGEGGLWVSEQPPWRTHILIFLFNTVFLHYTDLAKAMIVVDKGQQKCPQNNYSNRVSIKRIIRVRA